MKRGKGTGFKDSDRANESVDQGLGQLQNLSC